MHRLEFVTLIPGTMSTIWDFFSSPSNLSRITPPEMNFIVETPLPELMYEGMIIGYKVNPFPGVRVSWLTEITHIKEGKFFIDEQRSGPYQIWHHEHHFREVEGGIEMKDILIYKVPFGFMGTILDKMLIFGRVKAIFNYREKIVKQLFPGQRK
jgi:ligand-binding SRPBCC domain-containing protein